MALFTFPPSEGELRSALQPPRKRWFEIARLLQRIRWEIDGKEEMYGSFATYLRTIGERSGTSWNMLHRFYKAAEFIEDLRRAYPDAAIPSLEQLPVGPESLEILSRLQKVTEKAAFERLLGDVIKGQLLRRQLKEIWEQYKHGTSSAIRRQGRDVLELGGDAASLQSESAYRNAIVSLIVADPSPIAEGAVSRSQFACIPSDLPPLCAVCVVSPNLVRRPELHGVLIAKEIKTERFETYRPLFDRLWLIRPEGSGSSPATMFERHEQIGILDVAVGRGVPRSLVQIRPARLMPESAGVRVGETALSVLGGLLRRV